MQLRNRNPWKFRMRFGEPLLHLQLKKCVMNLKIYYCGCSVPINLGICYGCWTSLVLNQPLHQFCSPRIASNQILRIWFWKCLKHALYNIDKYIYIVYYTKLRKHKHICGLKKTVLHAIMIHHVSSTSKCPGVK